MDSDDELADFRADDAESHDVTSPIYCTDSEVLKRWSGHVDRFLRGVRQVQGQREIIDEHARK